MHETTGKKHRLRSIAVLASQARKQEDSMPRTLTRTNEGAHGREHRRISEGSRPRAVDAQNRWLALPDAHNRALPAVDTAPTLVKGGFQHRARKWC
jgi:hypothetical protein